jgi:hypothetical protein
MKDGKEDRATVAPVTVERLVKWVLSGDTGISSKAIVGVMEGVAPSDSFHGCHPSDGGDFGRCYRLLEAIPEYKTRMAEMKCVSPEWSVLVDHWEELTELYRQDGKMYQRMSELLDTCRKRGNVVKMGNGVSFAF